ncbi:hypothetical protein O3M35_004266 [Rhynocoris fuscipes]|uniref:Ragulator complex protein LAMTOR1 n=1 Tax=Rhynocoris fuscipes TaxID=488301 RepID=A0AAW1CGX1_9HEMI
MGCCLSCCDDSKSQGGESDERTRLITDPVINSSDGQRIPSINVFSEPFATPYQQSLPSKSDEQSMLNKILQQTAINVIDISTLGPHMMEQNEYLERRSAYLAKIETVNQSWSNLKFPEQYYLKDVAFPEQILSEPPISEENFVLINTFSTRTKDALKDIKVIHTEDLVVPFSIPQKRTNLPSAHTNLMKTDLDNMN